MENKVLHLANTRGDADHSWLRSKHSFSFAGYHNNERMHFGALRVLNDDTVSGGMGFGRHPHENMEIISIPLEGDLEHKDSMGNTTVIRKGDVQVMSAGTGIQHSEYNKNKNEAVKFLQIWILPDKKNVTPRYGQVTLNDHDRHNKLQLVISPQGGGASLWIHQDAWFSIGKFDRDVSADYTLKAKENGVYIFNLSGSVDVNGQKLSPRDGYGLWDTGNVHITAASAAEFLIIEVPMNL